MSFAEMGFIDSCVLLWVSLPTFTKVVFLILFVLGACLFLALLMGDKRDRIVGFILCPLFFVSCFISPFLVEAPTTSQLRRAYENGDFDRNVFERFAPYALMKDREIEKQKEGKLREQREQIAKEEAEARMKIEQREYRKAEAEKILDELKQSNQNNKEKR